MKGIKGTPYDGGHRVPCFIHWPAKKLNNGVDINELTAHIDILPTLVEWCDLKTPEKATKNLNGKSLAGLIEGREKTWQNRTLFVHCQNSEKYHKWKNAAVITAKWRLVNKDELYDIKKDPEQKTNVAHLYPEVLVTLQKKI